MNGTLHATQNWTRQLEDATSRFVDTLAVQTAHVLPRLAFVVLLLLLGALAGWVARRVVRGLVRQVGLEALAERLGVSKLLYRLGTRDSVAQWSGRVAQWTLWLVALLAAADSLNISMVSQGLAAIVAFVPHLVASVAILLLGAALASVLRRVLSTSRPGEVLRSPHHVAAGAYYFIMGISAVMALRQLGIQTELLTVLIAVSGGAFAVATAVSFAFGSAGAMRDFSARQQLSVVVQPGDAVVLDGRRMVLLRYSTTLGILQDEARRVYVVRCSELLDKIGEVELAVPRGDTP